MNTKMQEKVDLLNVNIGNEIAVSKWKEISQETIDQWAMFTGDDQWIHTDKTRSITTSPYGGTIGQGLISLCFLITFSKETLVQHTDFICINYGINHARFPAPVKPGQRIRARLKIASVHRVIAGGSVAWVGSVEIENSEKPACVAEIISQYFVQ